jgi:hypothetical protein
VIPKARLEEMIAHLNSINNPDNPDQLYAEVVDALTELLQYQWRDAKVELPEKDDLYEVVDATYELRSATWRNGMWKSTNSHSLGYGTVLWWRLNTPLPE